MKEPYISSGLSELLGRHRLSQSALARASRLQPGTISALYHDRTDSISLVTLAKIVSGLRVLTGQPYTAADLLRYHPEQ